MPEDPQDGVVAAQYKKSISEFNKQAKDWTAQYAISQESVQEAKIKTLMEMGFDRNKCRAALEKFNWNENQAAEFLFQ